MLTNILENRGKEFSSLLKLGDYLGRSLRENIELFHIEDGNVTYLTESGKVIEGKYSINPLKLVNVVVDDCSILEDQDAFEALVSKKVSGLLFNLMESDYSEAEGSLDKILHLYETKLSYTRIKERLEEKTERFREQTKILSSKEFVKVSELKRNLVEFLKENKDVASLPEIRNGLKLASIVSKSFNLPKISIDELASSKTFSVKQKDNSTIYDHLCKQELIAKELLEAKENFDTVWANNDSISDLASMVFESNTEVLENKLAEVVSNIPYFALATKKQLHTLIENCIGLLEVKVSDKDITSFVGKIFEMKKGVKTYIINLLNEKYGINVSNLKDIPTFTNLVRTESQIFESLSKACPKNSVLKQHLLELSNSLKIKNGSESIDVVDFLDSVFTEAGYKNNINETSLLQYLDFSQVADDLGKIGAVLKMLKPALAKAGVGSGEGAGEAAPMDGGGEIGDVESMLGGGAEGPTDPAIGDAEAAAGEVNAEEDMALQDGLEEENPTEGGEEDIPQEGIEGEEGMEGGGMEDESPDPSQQGFVPGEEIEEPSQTVGADDISQLVASIEDLLLNIKSEIGDPVGEPSDGEFEEGGEEGGLEEPESEFEEGGEEVSEEPEGEFEEEGSEEEEEVPFKGKPKFKK
jgi:hypothetical protein